MQGFLKQSRDARREEQTERKPLIHGRPSAAALINGPSRRPPKGDTNEATFLVNMAHSAS